MRIATTGLNLPEGKVKYEDPVIIALTEQFQPKKVSPYYVSLLPDDYLHADVIVVTRERILDLLIHDIEKLETRRANSGDPAEQAALDRMLASLEAETPVCEMDLPGEEAPYLQTVMPLSARPTLVLDDAVIDEQALIPLAMQKGGFQFFYTAGKQEVRAWLIRQGDDAVTCAGKIHTDLARGFIKAEIIPVGDLLGCHSMQDARQKGLTQLVDRDYVIPEKTVLEIRFNV